MKNNDTENVILQVPIEDIIPNRFQPRLAFDDNALKDLADSIKQHGIIQPLVLRRIEDKYEIIAGERRYKAAKMAGLASVPAIISNLDDNTSAEVAIVENIQRKDLTAIEEARSYQALLDKGYMKQEELAKKMGLSQSAISNKLRLLSLSNMVQEAILQEKISERHARTLLKVPNHQLQNELLNKVITERLTVKQLEEEVKKLVIKPEEEVKKEEPVDVKKEEDLTNMSEVFSKNPAQTANKFFNFLEDSAVNLDMDEMTPNEPEVELDKNIALINQTENIEMLDDFAIEEKESQPDDKKNEYYIEVLNTIRNLELNKDKVEIEEIDLLDEYQIIIKIKKEENN